MGFINLAEKTIQAKLVYYGVGMGGKTTSLQAVHGIMCPRNEVQLVSINTEEDATLLFDFLPINLGLVEGFKIKIQGFTVPGQPKYRLMRKYVLSGADAVVFVVDSDRSRLEENKEAWNGLMDNLRQNGIQPDKIPLVVQYNKRDLDDILSEEELDREFLLRDDMASFPSVATDGHGVFEAFVHASACLVEAKVRQYGLGRGDVDPVSVAAAARDKLWGLRVDVRDRDLFKERGPTTELTVLDDDGPRHADSDGAIPDVPVSGAEPTDAGPIDPGPIDPGAVENGHDGVEAERRRVLDEAFDAAFDEALDVAFDGAIGASAPSGLIPFEGDVREEFASALDGVLDENAVSEEGPVNDPATDPADRTLQADDGQDGPQGSPLEILSDAELDIELRVPDADSDASVDALPREVTDRDGDDEHLLDKTVQSNVELATRFGELDQYRALLERRIEDLVTVAQNTVHDLNRPLSAIKLMLGSLAKGYMGDLEPKAMAAVENGLSATRQMERLIEELLDSSRLDHDGMRMDFKPVDMNELLAQVVQRLHYEFDEVGTAVRVAELPEICGDAWALTKAFTNVLGNAVQYCHPERAPTIHVAALDEPDRVVFSVADNGIGIPEGDRPRLFHRFERGSNTGGVSGTGLGLHIIREVILGHGGDVWVESEEGLGTVFYLGIPREPVQPPHSQVTEIAARADL